jgi:hypothetical protein
VFSKTKFVVFGVIILVAACAAQAKGVGPPTIDIQKVCRASEREIRALFSDITRDVFGPCMDDERDARQQLIKDWSTTPAFDKERCVQPEEYLPSYVEWKACIDMTEDVRKMMKERPGDQPADANAGGQSPQTRSGSESRQCPVVRWRGDGTISTMIAC